MKACTSPRDATTALTLVMLVAIIQASQLTHAAGPWYVAPGGNDSNNCLSPTTACATINGALNKSGFIAGDTIRVAVGTYTGRGVVVGFYKSAALSGGWNSEFTTQTGISTIDGQASGCGIVVSSDVTATVERFNIKNGACAGITVSMRGYLILNNSTISGNNETVFGAGGIYNNWGTVILNSSTVSGNSGYAGGINNSGTMTLTNSIVDSNTVRPGAGGAGGILNHGTLTLNNSVVSHNTSTSGYGGVHNYGGTLTLNNSTVSGNTSTYQVGGIENEGTLTLNNSTVSGNTSLHEGGGIRTWHGTLTLNNSTVSGNTAGQGGGIFNYSTLVTLRNSIVAGNTGTSPDCSGTIDSAGYNLVGDTSGCTFIPGTGDLTNVNAHIGPLIGATGGPRYHPLLSGSPAIDAGDPAGCTGSTGLLTTDQRGVARVGRCDIGAYEYTTPGPAASIYAFGGTPQRTSVLSAFRTPLQAAVLDGVGSPVNNAIVAFFAPASGASGVFSDTGTFTTTAVTNESGIATAATFTANGLAGTYTVTATVSGVAIPANFLLSNFFQVYLPIVARNLSGSGAVAEADSLQRSILRKRK